MWFALGWLFGVAFAGDAPSLAATTWVRAPAAAVGEPLQVIEIWATWCGPCHATFPLLTRLQQAHGDRLQVLALTDDPIDQVRRTVAARGDEVGFAVGVVDSEVTQAFLFGGFGGRGIPSVYLVRGGAVLWGGPPDELEAKVSALIAPPM